MNVGKEYRRRWRRRQRRGKQVLLIALQGSALQVSCWLDGCRLWRQERMLEAGGAEQEVGAALGDVLRDILLAAAAEENMDALVLPDEEQTYSERLTLPLLAGNELRQAIAWEAGQLVPWPAGSFTTAYSIEEIAGQEMRAQLWAMRLSAAQEWRRLAARLQLRLRAILPGWQEETAQRAWYDGAAWTEENLLGGAKTLAWRGWERSPYWRVAAAGSLVLSLLIYAGVYGGRYFALQSAQASAAQLQKYASLRQRYAYSQKLAAELERYKEMEQSGRSAGGKTSVKLEALGRRLEAGCWLQSVQNTAGQWQVEGRAGDIAAVHRLVRRWQEDKDYGQVELLRSQQEKEGAGFALRLKERQI